MGVVDDIRAARDLKDVSDDDRRRRIYGIKVAALVDVILNGAPPPQPIPALIGRTVAHEGFQFCINQARETSESSLMMSVTFIKPPAEPVTHLITIVNPPVLPRRRSGSEKHDLIVAVSEMLEGFV